MKKLKKLKPNLKLQGNNFIIILICFFCNTLLNAQIDSVKNTEIQKRINSLITDVDKLTATYYPMDSLQQENDQLKRQLAQSDSLLAAIAARHPEEKKAITKAKQPETLINTDGTVKTAGKTYVVFCVYNLQKRAEFYQAKKKYSEFEIIESKSGKLFYLATQVGPDKSVYQIMKHIKQTFGFNTWVVKL